MSVHVYSTDFFDYIDSGSRASARVISQLLLGEMKIKSLLDVGSGHGAWAAEWLNAGVPKVTAVDGDYVKADQLAIPAENFIAHDLSEPLDLGRRFDLVQSLEVAEHLSPEHASGFIDNLTRHGDVILFSAAVPHQGGEHHVNEQLPQYWRELFAARGYEVFDWVRPRVAGNRDVKAWYRFNTLIYANAAGKKRLSSSIVSTRIARGRPVPVGGDFAWSLRRAAVRLMPATLVKPVAMAKSIVEVQFRK
jgi:SAM-dependent methyltransferase